MSTSGSMKGNDACPNEKPPCKPSETVIAIVDLQMNVVQTCSEVINAVNDKDKQISVLDTYISDLQKKLDEKDQINSDLKDKMRCQQNEICELKKINGVCDSRTQYYADRTQKLEDEAARMKEENEAMRRENTACSTDRDRLKCKLDKCQKENCNLTQQLNKVMSELDASNASRNEEMGRLRESLNEKETMLKKCCVCNKEKANQITKLTKEIDDLKQERDQLREQASDFEIKTRERIRAFEEDLEQKESQLAECYGSTRQLNDQLQKIMQDLNGMKLRSEDLERDYNNLQTQKREMEQQLQDKECALKEAQRTASQCNSKTSCLEKEIKQLKINKDELEREKKALEKKLCGLQSKASSTACNYKDEEDDCEAFYRKAC